MIEPIRFLIRLCICCFFMVAASAAGWAAPGQADSAAERIIGGSEAVPGAYPWMAAIIRAGGDTYMDQFCGGALVGSRWVLTAAHCVYDLSKGAYREPDEIEVVMGVHDLRQDQGERFALARIVPHPDYLPHTQDNDLALLELDGDASQSTLAVYSGLSFDSRTADLTGEPLTLIGWGTTAYPEVAFPDRLQEVTVPIVSNAVCRSAYAEENLTVTDNMLCAGCTAGGKDSCYGDSGGPAMIRVYGRWVQAGVVSWGYGCALPDYYGVYTRLANFLGFLKQWVSDLKTWPVDFGVSRNLLLLLK